MVKKMLINACHPEECRVAVVADGLLEELDVEVYSREATLGNIYKAMVTRVEPSLQAAFVDYGGPRNGFLSINDVHPSYFSESFENSRRRPRMQEVFKKDDHVIVQVAKEERSTKGASLTTNISLAGRYLVLMPGTDLCGVSRKIQDEVERKKLKEILKQFKLPENMGFIIRTAGMGRTKTELSRDLDYLLKLWNSIEKNMADKPAPALLHREHDVVIRSIREHFSADINEILVDDREVHKRVRDFFHEVMPRYEALVKHYQEKRPLFNKYQLEEQIEQVYSGRVKLKSGGYIVIEPTEALVSIDVNSGGAIKEKGIEETAFKVNCEAAAEVARQLRLRDLGGIIAVDFIDMTPKKNRQEVEKLLKAALKRDRAKTKVLRLSSLGLMELTRQRIKSVLGTGEYLDCPICDGAGKIRSPEVTALSVFRRIKSLLIKADVAEVKVVLPAKVAEYLLNNMRAQLVELETMYRSKVIVTVGSGLSEKDITVEALKEEPPEHSLELPHAADVLEPASAVTAEVMESIEEVIAEVTAELAPAEEASPDSEKRKAKKPSRRRRRSKKKTGPAAEDELQAQEQQQADEPAEPAASMSEDESEPAHPEPTAAETSLEEPVSVQAATEPEPVVDVPWEVTVHHESQLSGITHGGGSEGETDAPAQEAVADHPQVQPDHPESGAPTDSPAAESTASQEQPPAAEASETAAEDEQPKEPSKEKTRKRKSLLQSYLPFS